MRMSSILWKKKVLLTRRLDPSIMMDQEVSISIRQVCLCCEQCLTLVTAYRVSFTGLTVELLSHELYPVDKLQCGR